MPRDSRSQSPVNTRPISDRSYRDRSDARPKRKDRDGGDGQPARKKIQLQQQENKYPSVNELKRRIRDVKRLLNKANLPADARIVQERALAGYEKDLEDEEKRRDRSKMIKKYHFVRFLDRKTATKDVNRLLRREKEISSSDIDAATKKSKLAALAQKIHVARVNLNYTIYYPLTEKYIAVYATVKKDEKEEKKEGTTANDDSDGEKGVKAIHATAAEKPAMWHVVEKSMKDGTLDLLRDGKLKSGDGEKGSARKSEQSKAGAEKASAKSKKSESKKDKKSSQRAPAKNDREDNNDDGDESDGGFFEM